MASVGRIRSAYRCIRPGQTFGLATPGGVNACAGRLQAEIAARPRRARRVVDQPFDAVVRHQRDVQKGWTYRGEFADQVTELSAQRPARDGLSRADG